MIRFLNDPPIDATTPLAPPTEDDLKRRRRFLDESAGAWADEDRETIARAIATMFDAAKDVGSPDKPA